MYSIALLSIISNIALLYFYGLKLFYVCKIIIIDVISYTDHVILIVVCLNVFMNTYVDVRFVMLFSQHRCTCWIYVKLFTKGFYVFLRLFLLLVINYID